MKFTSLILILLFLFSCSENITKQEVCLNGNCQADFWIDTQGHPGTYLDNNEVWHIKHAGLNYFTIKGNLSPLDPHYVINNVPLVETSFDSNFFYIPGNVIWTYPVYSYQGLWNSSQMNTPIPIGTQTYTFPALVNANIATINNLAGYSIQPHTDWYANQSVLQSYFATYSKYTYNPQQSMVFFPDFIGKTATIYIEVGFGEGESVVKKELKIVFEQ
jgi:hypothetical protein